MNAITRLATRGVARLKRKPRHKLTPETLAALPHLPGVAEISGAASLYVKSVRDIADQLIRLQRGYAEPLHARVLIASPEAALAIAQRATTMAPLQNTGQGRASHATGCRRQS